MSDRRRVGNDPDQPITFEIAGESPHVFAYRVGVKRPTDDGWTEPGCEGDTDETNPARCDLGRLPDGTLLDIPVAVGGAPSSAYRGRIRLIQGGEPAADGDIRLAGRTSEDGAGAEFVRVVLT
jgi:hypothetical protein